MVCNIFLDREAAVWHPARVARKLRIQYPGAVYHVMNRGDRREAIFEDDQDYQLFLQTLAEACQKALWQVHAYCLMHNHFHLVIETLQPTLVTGSVNGIVIYFLTAKPRF